MTENKTNRYEGSISQSLGYSFEIDAPKELTESEMQSIMRAFINYSDEFNQEMFNQMMREDSDYHELEELAPERIELAKLCTIESEVCYREGSLNDFDAE